MSRQAMAAALLGLLSLLFYPLTGIPAVVLAVRALRSIERSTGRLEGRGLAVLGLVLGIALGLVLPFGAVHLLLFLPLLEEFFPMSDPAQIRSMAGTIGSFELPPDLVPVWGINSPSLETQMACFADRHTQPTTILCLMRSREADPEWIDFARQQAALRQATWRPTDQRRQFTCQVEGRAVNVTETKCIGASSGVLLLEFTADIPQPESTVALVIVTPQQPAPARTNPAIPPSLAPLKEADVRRFLESLRLRQRADSSNSAGSP
jgi:hypothetical protein